MATRSEDPGSMDLEGRRDPGGPKRPGRRFAVIKIFSNFGFTRLDHALNFKLGLLLFGFYDK